MKKHLTLSNLFTWLFVAAIAAMFIFPTFKATVIRGFMKVGLFQPSVQRSKAAQNYNRVENATFVDEQGREISAADLRGKIVFVNFWATWCPPCIAEMPSIQKLYDQFKGNESFVFLLVDVDHQPQKSREFLRARGMDLPLYFPGTGIERSLYSGSLPTTAVIDKNGNIVFHETGANDFSNTKFAEFLKSLR